ncbi:hypothetical protein [Holdemania sp. Marseille-P2844]|nr:hypothetical protein [Holdemania sp. Marseille-P2844]
MEMNGLEESKSSVQVGTGKAEIKTSAGSTVGKVRTDRGEMSA